jgi:GTP-binding protein HflX
VQKNHLLPPRQPGAADRAILVGAQLKGQPSAWTMEDSLEELRQLALTAGLEVVGITSQKIARPDPATWIGSGKAQELKEILTAQEAAYVLFDDELSPAQTRNLEKILGEEVRVIDRPRLILDIFGQHAISREGQLQVELAQYQYLLPRLAGSHAGLAQQVGGTGAGPVGLRGPGETQLELDRRQARRRISVLKRELEEVRTQRRQQRRQRQRSGIPVVAIVGYTNAGKSSLLNALTGAQVLVQDKLFATLDPTTRRLTLPGGREALLTDTVGFIRKLPHDLVAAFRATLEGVEEASLIIHVVDSSHPHASELAATVDSVLSSLKVGSTPRLVAWNKIDIPAADPLPGGPAHANADSIAVSAKTGQNLDALLARIEEKLGAALVSLRILIPYDRYDLLGLLYEQATVEQREDAAQGIRLRVSVPEALAERLAEFTDREQE